MDNTITSDNQSNIIKSESKILNFFWIGFIIYTSAFAISTTEQVNYVICNLFQILGLMLILTTSFFLVRLKIEDDYLKVIYSLFIIWTLGIIIRGFVFKYEFIKLMLFNSYEGLFIYLTPLILLFPKNLHHIKKLFIVIVIVGMVYTFYDMLFFKQLIINYDIKNSQNIIEYFSKTLSIPCGFIIVTYMYHSKRMNLFALFVIMMTFFFSIIRARRGLSLLTISSVVVAYFVYLFYSKNRGLKIVFFILLLIFITLGIAYSRSVIGYFSTNSATSWFIERVGQDTRSEVEHYFYRDLKPVDWIIGKGINGQYFCPGVVEGTGKISIFRRGIETDYLTIILKGGIISLGLMLFILIPAIIKGLFYSKNMLAKASAIWIILYLGALYPSPVTAFTLNYLVVWISVGLCYSKEIRNLSEDEVRNFFKVAIK